METLIPLLLNEITSDMTDALKCFRKYQKTCMTSYPRTVFGIFTHDVRKQVKKRCNSDKGRKEFLKHAKCMGMSNFDEIYKCANTYIAHVEYIVKNVKTVDQIPASCCSYHVSHDCIRKETAKACDSVTGPETTAYVDEMITAAVSETIDFTCGGFKSVDDCNKKMNKELWASLLAVKASDSHYKAPMTPLITMFQNTERS